MKILVIGSGGREHALAWKIRKDSPNARIYCAPGNAGTAQIATNIPLKADNIEGIAAWAENERPDLTVVGPEAPLCLGIADRMAAKGLRVFGPTMNAARIEGSKVFSKEIMRAAGVPTAAAETFSDESKALDFVKSHSLPLVIKADGLAAGKGVIICKTLPDAENAIRRIMTTQTFGSAGRQILIEEYLEGEEASVLALVDGQRAVLLPTARDHKRVFDGDRGPNTGGMGAYSPSPLENRIFLDNINKSIFEPTISELVRRGIIYRGVLYAGLMITKSGPKVLEFNCRFGDPETQAILPRLKGSLVSAMEACIDGQLRPEFGACRKECCVCIVMAAGGYPDSYRSGHVITGLDQAAKMENVIIYHAGTKIENNHTLTAGGRILGVTALMPDLKSAAKRAYEAAAMIKFEGAHYRRDIALNGT